MKWLTLAFFVSAAYLPLDYARIGPSVTPDLENISCVEYGFKFKAFDCLALAASDRSYQIPSGGPYFKPFREDYKISLSLETKNFDLGIRHECDHEVKSWSANQGGYSSGRTEIFATIHAEISF
jgi:hypothetical protein